MDNSSSSSVFSFSPQTFTIGLSANLGVTVLAGQVTNYLRLISGGSLSIVDGISTIGASGFLVDTSILRLDIRNTFYLAATGATVICSILTSKTSNVASGGN